MIIRFICALIWVGLLCCFSYSELIFTLIIEGFSAFIKQVYNMSLGDTFIFANVGMVIMLYIDDIIVSFITKRKEHPKDIQIRYGLIFSALIISVFSIALCQFLNHNHPDKKPYEFIVGLFLLFLFLLLVYKSESLKISHYSDNNSIKPIK